MANIPSVVYLNPETANLIRFYRKQNGFTMDNISDQTGLGKGYISKIEKNSLSAVCSTDIEKVLNACTKGGNNGIPSFISYVRDQGIKEGYKNIDTVAAVKNIMDSVYKQVVNQVYRDAINAMITKSGISVEDIIKTFNKNDDSLYQQGYERMISTPPNLLVKVKGVSKNIPPKWVIRYKLDYSTLADILGNDGRPAKDIYVVLSRLFKVVCDISGTTPPEDMTALGLLSYAHPEKNPSQVEAGSLSAANTEVVAVQDAPEIEEFKEPKEPSEPSVVLKVDFTVPGSWRNYPMPLTPLIGKVFRAFRESEGAAVESILASDRKLKKLSPSLIRDFEDGKCCGESSHILSKYEFALLCNGITYSNIENGITLFLKFADSYIRNNNLSLAERDREAFDYISDHMMPFAVKERYQNFLKETAKSFDMPVNSLGAMAGISPTAYRYILNTPGYITCYSSLKAPFVYLREQALGDIPNSLEDPLASFGVKRFVVAPDAVIIGPSGASFEKDDSGSKEGAYNMKRLSSWAKDKVPVTSTMGNILRAYRRAYKVSEESVAEELNVTAFLVRQMESEGGIMSKKNLYKFLGTIHGSGDKTISDFLVFTKRLFETAREGKHAISLMDIEAVNLIADTMVLYQVPGEYVAYIQNSLAEHQVQEASLGASAQISPLAFAKMLGKEQYSTSYSFLFRALETLLRKYEKNPSSEAEATKMLEGFGIEYYGILDPGAFIPESCGIPEEVSDVDISTVSGNASPEESAEEASCDSDAAETSEPARPVVEASQEASPDIKGLSVITDGIRKIFLTDRRYGASGVSMIAENFQKDLGFAFGYSKMNLAPLADKSKETKQEFLNEVKELIKKYSKKDEPEQIDIYVV